MNSKLFALWLLCLPGTSWAGPNDALVDKVWVGESVPGQNSATLELNITTVKLAFLVGIASEVAERVEIHAVSKVGGKMKVRVVDRLRLPSHRTTAFGSKSLFLIMAGLKRELNVGDKVAVTIVVEYASKHRQTIVTEATVKKMALSYRHLGSDEVYDHR
ncbi:MAG: copper chaperone PCu(A)C [Gallionellaceae bacterium]